MADHLVLDREPDVAAALLTLPRLPGTDVVGHGYDATGEYADAGNVMLPIYELGQFDQEFVAANGTTYSVPTRILDQLTVADMSHGEYHRFAGETVDEYRKSLNVSTSVSAKYMLFSGSLKTEFHQEELASFNHTFVTLQNLYEGWKIALPDLKTLQMLPSARADIDGTNGTTPEEVIRKYGTHVIASAVIGGRATYTCFVDRSRYSSQVSVTTAAEASYKGALGLDVSMATQYKEAVDQLRSSSRIDFKTIGGDFEASFNPDSFSAWLKAFKSHPVLIDFTRDGLVEIHRLAATKERQDAIRQAFESYLSDSQALVPDDTVYLEVRVVTSGDLMGTDGGSHAHMDLAVFRPKFGGDWKWIGESANRSDRFIIMKEKVPGSLTAPLGYERAWCDAGSGRDHGYSIWNIVAPPNYRALGGLARLGVGRTDYDPPAGGLVAGLMCVHESLCVRGKVENRLLWNDAGTKADENGSVWPIVPADAQGTETYTFYSAAGHGYPANQPVYVLKKDPKKIDRHEL